MNEAQKKAWDCLKDLEQKSLFLQLSENKSSWEAGEILKLSHYKYLEVRERSEKFFRLFSDFFEKHTSLFRPDCPCERSFQDYIEGCLERRLTRREAMVYIGDSVHLLSKVTNRNIERNMKRLRESEDEWDKDTARIVFEFDRWNNFRILPKMLQQPSAFKRRANKKDKIYIKYLLNRIPEWMHTKLRERFKYKVKLGKKKYWVCLISEELYTDGYLLLPVRPLQEVIDEFSRFYMYVFPTKDDADTFGFMVSKFMIKTGSVRLGQGFWPEYRCCIEKALNYNQVNNIEFSVKNLDMAYNPHKTKRRKKAKSTGAERIDDTSAFYKKE